ncbi:hypothetical protein PH586_18115 [Pseudomonas sp. SA3-5]|uniref:DUF4892 domain-containing protein n=1 Tax=Pseudomonas aestuarii TaxID=3018340 RepID=A0ABT4XJC3_9PSED|nr:hypothetical protein [Pseudomonas aestuarii]MDA7088304.1 hypothetical protein [Pseudomonas aestuarii]
MQWRHAAVLLALLLAPQVYAQDPESLRARHAALAEQLSDNPFQRPLHLESRQTADALQGDIYALIEQPYAVVGTALQGSAHWCDILILHLNVKSCGVSSQTDGESLRIHIGRKSEQTLADAYLFEFTYRVATATPDFLQVLLEAEDGPLGTSRYRINLEVVALDAQRSFLHLSYSYAYGMAASVAAQSYLATLGRNKVGFSILEHSAEGQPVYIGGMRGVIERNTMRYYLAIEAYLGALAAPPATRLEQRLTLWHSAIEQYPAQLHELEREQYLTMKHKEIQRQQADAAGE